MSCQEGDLRIQKIMALIGTVGEPIKQARVDYFTHLHECPECREERDYWRAGYSRRFRSKKNMQSSPEPRRVKAQEVEA